MLTPMRSIKVHVRPAEQFRALDSKRQLVARLTNSRHLRSYISAAPVFSHQIAVETGIKNLFIAKVRPKKCCVLHLKSLKQCALVRTVNFLHFILVLCESLQWAGPAVLQDQQPSSDAPKQSNKLRNRPQNTLYSGWIHFRTQLWPHTCTQNKHPSSSPHNSPE